MILDDDTRDLVNGLKVVYFVNKKSFRWEEE